MRETEAEAEAEVKRSGRRKYSRVLQRDQKLPE